MMNISEDNKIHLQRFKNDPPCASYIAGFIDGDGCIFIRKIYDGYQSGFTITQCRTNALQVLRYHFGGSITSSEKRNNKIENKMDENNEFIHKHNVRNQYNLLIRSNEYEVLLDYLRDSFIIDAEGCLFINKDLNNISISISQKNHPQILNAIVKFLGFGKVYINKYEIFNKTDCLKFIQLVKTYLIVKYNQAIAFETFLQTNDIKIKEQMYSICNEEKHKIENFVNLNQNNNEKEGYLETLRLKNIKQQVCKEIQKNIVYSLKSKKMKGKGNHNFGKIFSQETKKKMSISIREAKGSVSDEIIIQVRKLFEQGNTNIEIQNLLNLPRHTITRIKNGEIICRNEEKIIKPSLTQIEINLSKRKILTDEIIVVIEKFIEKWKPMQVFDYLLEIRNKNNIINTITIDIIKNIKRNLANEKTIIYESELSKEKYEYYLQLLKKYKQLLT